MQKNKYIIITSILLLVTCSVIVYNFFLVKKDVYVNVVDLYDNFQMKIDLEKKIEATQLERKKILDSLELEFKLLTTQANKGQYTLNDLGRKREFFLLKERQFNEDNEAQVLEYKQQIWKQLKQYTKDFAEKNNYNSIIGSDEGYTVLYYSDKVDITNGLKEYANQRYKGGKK